VYEDFAGKKRATDYLRTPPLGCGGEPCGA
jgi:hypothetical protein